MVFAGPFHQPFRLSPSLANLTDIWDVAINGRPFRLDRKSDFFQQGVKSIEVLRQQSDTSIEPGQSSINRQDLWRSSQSSWHKGAGQRYRDKDDSDPERFWASRGVNVWNRDELSLLNDTEISRSTSTSAPKLLVAGDYLYLANGLNVDRFDGVSWTPLPFSSPTGTVTALATNGYTVWALTPTQTYRTTTDSTTWVNWIDPPDVGQAWQNVAYVRGRLLVTYKQFVYEVLGSSGTPTKLNPSEGNTAWKWTALTEGSTGIFAAGVSGNRSQIFRIVPPQDDPAAALGPPIPAAPTLPSGETVQTLYGYLGQIVIGTNRGIRVAEETNNGTLTIGALIKTPQPVLCVDGEGNFVNFGWSNFDESHTGIGRLNLAQLVDTGIYAYASDLMVETTGNITSVTTYKGASYFCLQGSGVYRQSASFVDNGWVQSGLIRYGVVDPKIAERVEIRHKKLSGSVSVSMSVDQNTYTTLGTNSLEGTITPTVAFDAKDVSGSTLELQTTLEPGNSGSPVVQHIELRSAVSPVRGEIFYVPLLLAERDNKYEARHPSEDYDALVSLARYQRSAVYQEKSKIFRVIVQDHQFVRVNNTSDHKWWNGTMLLTLMAPAS